MKIEVEVLINEAPQGRPYIDNKLIMDEIKEAIHDIIFKKVTLLSSPEISVKIK